MFVTAAQWARDNDIPYRQVRTALMRMYKHKAVGRPSIVDGVAMIQGKDQEARVLWFRGQFSYWIWLGEADKPSTGSEDRDD